MSKAYKCDACGKLYSDCKIYGQNYEDRKINRISTFTIEGRCDDTYDLCDECIEKIYSVLNLTPRRNKHEKG